MDQINPKIDDDDDDSDFLKKNKHTVLKMILDPRSHLLNCYPLSILSLAS
jgi:hypothetical protein